MNYSLDDVDLTSWLLATGCPFTKTLNWQKNVACALCSAGTRKENWNKKDY